MYVKLKNCTVLEPSSRKLEIVDIGIRDGIIATPGEMDGAREYKTIDARGRFVTPSWTDLHTHVYNLGTSLGVDADAIAKRSGVGVFVDAGSAGAGNFAGFREYVIKRSGVKIVSFLNIGFAGIPFFGIQRDSQVSEIPRLEVADSEACIACVRKNRKYIVGIKVRLSAKANGEFGTAPLKIAKDCARALKVPVMLHIGRPPPEVGDAVELLERGDILTHAFRSEPNSIIERDSGGRVSKTLREARKRGVIIDIGHGNGSFSFRTAEAALADGFPPDTISTDLHSLSLATPVYDLPTTMTKFLNLGMGIAEIIGAVTHNPSMAIGRPKQGVITPGERADLVVFEVTKLRQRLKDSTGEERLFPKAVQPVLRVKDGQVTRISWRAPGR